MSYDAVIEVIARLQIQPEFRTRFAETPERALREFALSGDELEGLARLPARELSLLDAMARFHRWTRIQEHVTWLDPYRRPLLRPLLEGFMSATPPRLLNRDDALAFCQWGERMGMSDGISTPIQCETSDPQNGGTKDRKAFYIDGLKELCRFERLRLEVAWGLEAHPQPLTVEFAYPVQLLAQWLVEHEEGWPDVAPQPVRVSFVKVPTLPAVLVRAEPESTGGPDALHQNHSAAQP